MDNGDVLVAFKTRGSAEQVRAFLVRPTLPAHYVLQGLAKGTNIPTVGQVQLAWHTAPAPTKPAAAEAAPSSSTMDTTEHGGAAPDAMLEDEELPTTGWGADGADDADVAVGMF
jgi:RNA-binding protein 26